MNALEAFTHSWLVEAIGWTLLHFIWQGALIAVLLLLCQRALASHAANARYICAVVALSSLALLPLMTFWRLARTTPALMPAEQGSNIVAGQSGNAKLPPGATDRLTPFSVDEREAMFDANDASLASSERWRNWAQHQITFRLPGLVGLWAVGVFLLALRFCGGWLLLGFYRRRGKQFASIEWQRRLRSLCRCMGVKQSVRLCQSVLIEAPTVIGWLRPIILVPPSAFLALTPQQLEAILLHELMHVRRYDYLVNLAQTFIEILFFYHPAVWWISAAIRREREHACDDAAARACGDALLYAKALTEMETLRRAAIITLPSPAVAALTKGGTLLSRIQRLITPEPRTVQQPRATLSLVSSGLACLLLLTLTVSVWLSLAVPATIVAQTKDGAMRQETAPRQVAIGFVALPALSKARLENESPLETTRLLIEKLTASRIPAVGFVQGSRLDWGERERRLGLLRRWRDAGLELGIGTHSHQWFYDTPYDEYIADFVKNEAIVRDLLAERGQKIRYFSYPFLNTGPNLETKQRFERFLQERGYNFVPYTIDNDDWFFAKVYEEARARNDAEATERIKAEYVPYMQRMFEFYEQFSRDLLGREIPQVLLLTPSRLQIDAFNELTEMIKGRGYKFVAMDEALSDEAFKSSDSYTGRTGISWLQRWAITRGREWRDEPRPGGYMEQFDYHKGGGNLKSKKPTPPPPPLRHPQ